ncbi:MAG: hypothetical protein RL391_529 [Actinomycetota bacterium]|jgi:NAD(P)-dependent dehydrogenase (short-subunit alcohol dehydrogenase family)
MADVVAVTGGANGLGAGITRVFARAGHPISVIDIDPAVESLAEGLRREGLDVTATVGDVTEVDTCRSWMDGCIRTHGRIDVLVNNAGQVRFTPLSADLETALADFDSLWAVNTRAVFVLGRLAAHHMESQGSGHIINIATDHIHTCGFPHVVDHGDADGCAWASAPRRPMGGAQFDVYDASKWAINGFTQVWSLALRKKGVRVNSICLGATESEMMRQAIRTATGREATAEETASWMKADEVAGLILELHREGPSGRSGDNIGIWKDHPLKLLPSDPILDITSR